MKLIWIVLKKTIKKLKNNKKLISKLQQRLKNERFKTFNQETNKISLNSDDDKRMQSIDLMKTYAYGTSIDQKIKYIDTMI